MADLNPYAAPAARVSDAGSDDRPQAADRLQRLRAVIIDVFLLALAGTAMAAAIPALAQKGVAAGGVQGQRAVAFAGVVALAFLMICNLLLLYRQGQTIGKKTVGIRIVRSDGGRAGLRRIVFLRIALFGLLGSIPHGIGTLFWLVDTVFIFGRPRRCLHDYLADTIVVKV